MIFKRSSYYYFLVILLFNLFSCDNYFKNDYKDNSPTSGYLKVYYDEGLGNHVLNQAYTFESLYPNATIQLFSSSETEAIRALYNDSCESIVIARLLSDKEKKAFESKNYFPKYSAVAKTGVALICNASLPITRLAYNQVVSCFNTTHAIKDSTGKEMALIILFDKSTSSVVNYMLDSVVKKPNLPAFCTTLNSSIETINYVADHASALAFIDFATLSDRDDSVYKANRNRIKFLAISSKQHPGLFEFPNQSSFKLNTYPFTRTIYVMRKTGDFTLAKGFESFVAGPKGQLVFLKQGLLPNRQGARIINVNLEQNRKSE